MELKKNIQISDKYNNKGDFMKDLMERFELLNRHLYVPPLVVILGATYAYCNDIGMMFIAGCGYFVFKRVSTMARG